MAFRIPPLPSPDLIRGPCLSANHKSRVLRKALWHGSRNKFRTGWRGEGVVERKHGGGTRTYQYMSGEAEVDEDTGQARGKPSTAPACPTGRNSLVRLGGAALFAGSELQFKVGHLRLVLRPALDVLVAAMGAMDTEPLLEEHTLDLIFLVDVTKRAARQISCTSDQNPPHRLFLVGTYSDRTSFSDFGPVCMIFLRVCWRRWPAV